MGNGVTSFLQHPSTTYFNPGTYSVKLVVRNTAGADSLTKIGYITVFDAPAPAFSADKITGCFPLAVAFTDRSLAGSGTVASWFWDFGDGNMSTQQHPSHTYTAAGGYSVTLKVTNSNGCVKTFTRPQFIDVAAGVTAGFTHSNPGACAAPVSVGFTNTSAGQGPLSFQWIFGDGSTSTAANPSHTYVTNGLYPAALIAVSAQGCADTAHLDAPIAIGNATVAILGPDTVCAGDAVTYANASSPTPTGSRWTFGNGSTAITLDGTVSYTTPGNYTIGLVSLFGTCSDSVTKSIYVSPKPQVQFTASRQRFCSLPATVAFTNATTSGGTVVWDFGDGTSSTAANPVHTYHTEGTFTVKLTVTTAAGCVDSLVRSAFIAVSVPQVNLVGLPRTGCEPLTVTPSAVVLSTHTLASYHWNFGDGGPSSSPAPSHTYTGTGTYTVTLTYTTADGCTDSVKWADAVRTGTKPNAAFAFTPSVTCAFGPVSFTDSSTGPVTHWQWTFGDGGTSTQQNPLYPFSDTGYFNVQLVVFNNTCPDTAYVPNAVYIKPPVSDFMVGHNCTDKYAKTFHDRSIGATSWLWAFGDGTTSTQQNPSHTYAAPGVYTVSLAVSNDTCQHRSAQTVRVIDEEATLISADTVLCRSRTASFATTGINEANIRRWHWSFGDGGFADDTLLSQHTYATAGVYTASLVITDLLGCRDTATLPVNVYGARADFGVPVTVSCLHNNLITFADASTTDGTQTIVKWVWAWGDGTVDSSGAQPFRHSYTGTGNFAVSLTVTDAFGCTDVRNKDAAVLISQPTASFGSVDTLTCTGKPVQFNNASSGTAPQYLWSFGDGTASTDTAPLHPYAATGSYSVSLHVIDGYGCKDSMSRPGYVTVSYPKAVMSVSDSLTTCPPLLVNFRHSAIDYTSLTWDFGDGTSSTLDSPSHFYTGAGVYVAKLTATGPGGCTDVTTQRIEVKGPSGQFTYAPLSGCKPLTVSFTAASKNNATYTWDFADGNIRVTPDSILTHTYAVAGEYTPKLILTDAGGCGVAIPGVDKIKVVGVTAGFRMNQNRLCDRGAVQFTNTTVANDFIAGYQWAFGDGSTSNAQHPTHQYTAPGTYTVSLVVTTQNGCADTLRLVDTVRVFTSPAITVTGASSGCAPLSVTLNGNVVAGNAADLRWRWTFGNGTVDSAQNPAPQIYTVDGTYNAVASVTDSNGCKHANTVQVVAHRIPVVSAGPDVFVCRGSALPLTATGADTYTWSASPTLSCTRCPSPLAAPLDSADYVVRGVTTFGCAAYDTVKVTAHQPFALSVGPGDTVCVGTPVRLFAAGADRYEWIPALNVSNPSANTTLATPQTTTLYKVVAKDNPACFVDTGYVAITVWPYPVVSAGDDVQATVGSTVKLQPRYSADVSRYLWTPQQALSCATCPEPTLVARAERTTYKIHVTNEGGCASTDEITLFVICNGGNLFVPNTFSPNGDGTNDKFFVRGTGLNTVKSLRIYNRWGEVVFAATTIATNDETKGWDGSFKGTSLPPDVYVYTCEVVCTNNEVLTYNGNVTLLR